MPTNKEKRCVQKAIQAMRAIEEKAATAQASSRKYSYAYQLSEDIELIAVKFLKEFEVLAEAPEVAKLQ